MRSKLISMSVIASLVVSGSFIFSGCSKKPVPSEPAQITIPEPVQQKVIDVGEGMGSEESIDSNSMGMGNYQISEGRTNGPMLPIYFDFDKSNIREDQQSRIEGNADFLKSNIRLNINIEGNCDERGTNEYNMALGERRAQTAKTYLTNLGISPAKINTVSYGEEKPLLYGHDEYSWAQNRRADFVIR